MIKSRLVLVVSLIAVANGTLGCASRSSGGVAGQSDGAGARLDRASADEPLTDGIVSWSFERDRLGSVSEGWRVAETNGAGSPATWKIVADSASVERNQFFALTATSNEGSTFNLALANGSTFANPDFTLRVRAEKGEEDQGGGPVWRCADENNYYVCRFNPLEGNFRVYVVKDGRRKQLASAKVRAEVGRWYAVRATMTGDRIICYLDGKKLLEVSDSTFKSPGMIGLWTKADAVTHFDDITVAGCSASR